jgi:hypothetical protein
MSETTFRMIIAVSVLAAVFALVVQAALVIAVYRVIRKIREDTAGFFAKLGFVFGKIEPIFNQADRVIEKTELAID